MTVTLGLTVRIGFSAVFVDISFRFVYRIIFYNEYDAHGGAD